MALKSTDFEYKLDSRLIAQTPTKDRDSSRLLVDMGPAQTPKDCHVFDLCDFLEPSDLLVLNNTRVLKARLRLQKATGGQVELLALEPSPKADGSWLALIRPSRKVPEGTLLYNSSSQPLVCAGEHLKPGSAERFIRPATESTDILSILNNSGETPLPPYINQEIEEPDRYQTVYAQNPSSVAAPTAGLHLTRQLLRDIQKQGIQIVELELAVGIATFSPIQADYIADHQMHQESCAVPSSVLEACQQTKESGGRVVAVGTTVIRALESAALINKTCFRTDLFISPGFKFQIVDALLTNFHMPRSSLLVLLAAFMGERWKDLYAHASARDYRFLSFGDAMFVSRLNSNT